MTDQPDFEALRAKRNRATRDAIRRFAEKYDCDVSEVQSSANFDVCYCACASGGPCEHKWDGEPYESDGGALWSTTCSRCGMTAFSHSLRTAP